MNSNYFSRGAAFVRIVFARLRFVLVFVMAAIIVGYWDDLKNRVDKWTRPAVAPDSLAAAAASAIEFFCPMHPDVVRQEQGQCPKCGMPLVKRKKGEGARLPDDVLARVQLTPQRVALANVHTTAVEYRSLVREIHAVGVLDYDETRLARLSARVAGRADELYVTYSGQAIRQGDPVYSLYSPEVFTAQREYLLARKRVDDLPRQTADDATTDASAVYNASLQKLLLWGVSADQLEHLEQEYKQTGKVPTHLTVTSPISGIVVRKEITQGQYLQAGDAPFTVADLKVLWLKAKLFEQDAAVVNLGDAAEVTVEALAGQTLTGTVAFKAFQLDPETRTLDARIVLPNPGLPLRPGMFANVTFHVPVPTATTKATSPAPATAPAGMVLAVPRSAVIDTGDQKIVYVESSSGVFDMRAVKLGPIAGDFFPAISGIDTGERVVTVGTFLIDAENRLNPTHLAGQAAPMAASPHDHAAGGMHP